MRITASDNHGNHHTHSCGLDDCQRYYCSGATHRYLFFTCDTEQVPGGETACWEDGGNKHWIEYTGECPKCKHEYEMKKYERWAKEREAGHV